MTSERTVIDIMGYLAAACTTLSFIPQVVKIKREGGAGLSYSMLFIYLFGLAMWLGYGILLRANAVVVANAASIVLVAAAIFLKATVHPSPHNAGRAASGRPPEDVLECP